MMRDQRRKRIPLGRKYRREQRRLANIDRRNEFYKPILDDIRARERGQK